MIETTKFSRKPFFVDAVQVTEANMKEVAEWCSGEILEYPNETYIKVSVKRPYSQRQTQAHPGDWVLQAGKGFKVYPDKAFKQSFDETNSVTVQETPAAVEHVHHRDAGTGEYVTEKYAGEHPGTTVAETDKSATPTFSGGMRADADLS